MKKEISLAVLVGLFLGLVVTYGFYRAKTSFKPQEPGTSQVAEASPVPTTSSSTLAISAPLDESVHTTAKTQVSGTTLPEAFVVVILNDKETITTADTTGNFSVEITLESGSNIIQVFSVDEDGKVTSEEITVIYTTQSLEDTMTATQSASTPKPTATPKP